MLIRYLFEDFKDLRYELTWTSDGEEALRAMASSKYDVYLVDYHLGKYDGLEILREAIGNGCTSPIILLTGQGDQELDFEAMQAGAADYLVKGQFEAPLLERVLRYSLQQARSLEAIKVSETKFRSVIQSASDAIFLVDHNGKVTLWNKAAERIFGFTEKEIIGKPALRLMGKKSAKVLVKAGLDTTIKDILGSKAGKRIEADGRRKDGTEFPLEISGSLWETNDRFYYTAIMRDITDRKMAKAERDRLYNLSNDLLATISFDGVLLHLNPAWRNILGFENDELYGSSILDITHPDDRETSLVEAEKLKAGENTSFESRLMCKDGSHRWILWSTTPVVTDQISYAVGRNITDRKHAEEVLHYNALNDMLTNLPNRTQFMNHLSAAITKHESDPESGFAVLFLDLDRFKVINDGLGHLIGDKLLIAIAERMKAIMRPGDIVARLGGDEFTLLIHDVKAIEGATNVAERIQKTLAHPFRLDNYEVFSSASIGVILSDGSKRSPEDFLRDADSAMYRAKETGKARYEIFDQEMHIRNRNLLQLETDLRRAIERNEFLVYYQPIVCLKTNTIKEMEALIRWQHPKYGIVFPDEFINVAEETGLIIDIGEWVLRESCRQTKVWQETSKELSDITVSVNLSAKQLMHPSLIGQVIDVMETTSLGLNSLKLEVTETTVMENAEIALRVLNELNDLGVSLSTDDFGTGYSSLSYLHQFPFKRIKIDRSFIGKMDSDNKSEAIVRTVLLLGENLGIEVVAEGIETKKQLERLSSLGCGLGQGYLFSKPASAKFAGQLLENGLKMETDESGEPQLAIQSSEVIEIQPSQ